MKRVVRLFLQYQLGTLVLCLAPSVLYAIATDWVAGLKLFAIGQIAMQPFLIYQFKEIIFSGRRLKDKKITDREVEKKPGP